MIEPDEALRKRAFERLEKLLDTLDGERAKLIAGRPTSTGDVRIRESDNKALEKYVTETAMIATTLTSVTLGVALPQTAWDRIGKDEDDE